MWPGCVQIAVGERGRGIVGHACTARPSGQSRLFSGQAGDVTALGAAGVESRAESEVRKSEEGGTLS